MITSEPRKIVSGLAFGEGPVWLPASEQLLFTDIPRNRIMSWSATAGSAVWCATSHFAIGLARAGNGDVLTCEHTTRSVSVLPVDGAGAWTGERRVLARSVEGAVLNSPNDVVIAPNGDVVFTDPPFGVREEGGQLVGYQQAMERPCDVLAVTEDPDAPRVVVTGIHRPNGLCYSADGSRLYVSDSSDENHCVYVVDVDGRFEPRLLWTMPVGVPDGMAVDREGRIWVAGGDGVYVISPAGELLHRIGVPEMVTNVCFGGSTFSSLFLTTPTSVYVVEETETGPAWP